MKKKLKFATLLFLIFLINGKAGEAYEIYCPDISDIKEIKEESNKENDNHYKYQAHTTGKKQIEIKSSLLQKKFPLHKGIKFLGMSRFGTTNDFQCTYSTNERPGQNIILKLIGTYSEINQCTVKLKTNRFPEIKENYLICEE